MQYFIGLCSYIATKFMDVRTQIEVQSECGQRLSAEEKSWLAILSISNLFFELSHQMGFGTFANISGIHQDSQNFFLSSIWGMIKRNMFSFVAVLRSHHPGVTLESMQPYIQKASPPNVLSFFHLSYQSLAQDHVYLLQTMD
jgi:hypothetical protein